MGDVEAVDRSPLLRRLQAAPRWFVAALSLLLIAGAGAADWYSGNDIAFTAIYLLPISLAAWMLSRGAMLLVTILCAGTWLLVDAASHEFMRHPGIELLNVVFELGVFLCFGFLLSALQRVLATEQERARTDSLTGLRNRRAFWDAAEQELERCRRFGQPFSVAYIDVDDFKSVNDRLGHRVGDELLQAIALALQQGIRGIDVAARLGGDEFALLLPGTDAVGAGILLGKLREQLASGLRATCQVGCSVGCLTVREAPEDVEELVARADAVMYAAKRSPGQHWRQATYPQPAEQPLTPRSRRRARGDVAS
jgi:diguanylate cyclase (GGDEF)-like protein